MNLNVCITSLMCTVIAFAGDALICIFPTNNMENLDCWSSPLDSIAAERRTIEEACVQALRCAFELREHKIHSLSAHFAIS